MNVDTLYALALRHRIAAAYFRLLAGGLPGEYRYVVGIISDQFEALYQVYFDEAVRIRQTNERKETVSRIVGSLIVFLLLFALVGFAPVALAEGDVVTPNAPVLTGGDVVAPVVTSPPLNGFQVADFLPWVFLFFIVALLALVTLGWTGILAAAKQVPTDALKILVLGAGGEALDVGKKFAASTPTPVDDTVMAELERKFIEFKEALLSGQLVTQPNLASQAVELVQRE